MTAFFCKWCDCSVTFSWETWRHSFTGDVLCGDGNDAHMATPRLYLADSVDVLYEARNAS